MKLNFFIGMLSLILAVSGGACRRKALDPLWLSPGDYDLLLDATSGSKTGQRSEGILTLRRIGAADQPPRGEHTLYGWTDTDLANVGAPLCPSDTPANSHDPQNPGVLVWKPSSEFKSGQPIGAPILLIGTNDNKKASRGARDGCGIGLFVLAKEDRCVRGEWSRWGIVGDGQGRFKLCTRASGSQEVAPASAQPSK
jgi:hypothetical protein